MVTDTDSFGNYRAILNVGPYPLPPATSGPTQIVQGNPNSLGITGQAGSFAYDAVGNALYYTADGSTWTQIAGGSGQAQVFAGNYAGGQPNFTPTTTVAIAIDTSNGTQWNWYSGAWH